MQLIIQCTICIFNDHIIKHGCWILLNLKEKIQSIINNHLSTNSIVPSVCYLLLSVYNTQVHMIKK